MYDDIIYHHPHHLIYYYIYVSSFDDFNVAVCPTSAPSFFCLKRPSPPRLSFRKSHGPPLAANIHELMATDPSHCLHELVPESPELQSNVHWVKSDRHATAFLVLQNDKIIVEEYFNGRRKEDKSDVFSVSKSVVSLLIGIAAQKELVALDNPISYYTRPNETWSQTSRERESKITVSHVLQMTCGLDDDEVRCPSWDALALQPWNGLAYAERSHRGCV